jgi:hypothetical protein
MLLDRSLRRRFKVFPIGRVMFVVRHRVSVLLRVWGTREPRRLKSRRAGKQALRYLAMKWELYVTNPLLERFLRNSDFIIQRLYFGVMPRRRFQTRSQRARTA